MVDIFRKVDTMSRPMADTPKRRPRRRFDDDFKAQAVRLVLDEGTSVGSVARDLDLTETALREWVNRARADRTNGKTGLTTAEREELARLRKEVRILREEREILKKAAVNSTVRRNTIHETRRDHAAWASGANVMESKSRPMAAMACGGIAQRNRTSP